MNYKPMLAPNEEVDLSTLKYPLLASTKLDGIRCIFYKGQILSRSLKQIQNKQLREKFEVIRKYSEKYNLILDGEIYSPNLTFQEIVSFVMTEDFEDKKSIKKFGKILQIPEHLNYYIFDCLPIEEKIYTFKERLEFALEASKQLSNVIEWVAQNLVYSSREVEELFEKRLQEGYEGLILRDPSGKYKFGRGTVKEGLIYKVKPFVTFDGKIIDVIQATEVDENAEKTINELGYSVTSKKKNDRIAIQKASAFLVKYDGKDLKVTLSMTDEEKEEVWNNKTNYIGKWIDYKGMKIGAKDVPRHPVFLRFRENKDE